MLKNNNSASPNLNQGSKFVMSQEKYNKNMNSTIENTTSPNLGSIIEGMSEMSSYETSLDNLTNLAQINQYELSSSVAVQEYKKDYAAAWEDYNTQNSKLDQNMNTMFSDINNDLTSSEELNANLSSQENKKSEYVSSFQDNNTDIDKLNSRIVTVSAEETDSAMVVKSSGMHYLVYIILLITIISITIGAITTSEESRVANYAMLIVLLILVFSIAKWLYSKLY